MLIMSHTGPGVRLALVSKITDEIYSTMLHDTVPNRVTVYGIVEARRKAPFLVVFFSSNTT